MMDEHYDDIKKQVGIYEIMAPPPVDYLTNNAY